jgi:DNA topoisomerase II
VYTYIKYIIMNDLSLEKKDRHELALARPGMHIGSINTAKRECYIYDFKNNKVFMKEIMIANGFERVFMEILSNATDNSIRSRLMRLDPGIIEVWVNSTTVRIRNTGRPFGIKKYKKTDQYEQEVSFGEIGTSTNYNDKLRIFVAGLNGYGAKLTNIYSTEFKLVVADGKQRYKQIWTDNMYKKTKPVIIKSNEPSFTEVTYKIDFSRFNGHTTYDEDVKGLFAWHCINFAFNCKLPISFNDIVFEFKDILEYTSFITNQDISRKNYIHHVEWGSKKIDNIDKIETGINKKVGPRDNKIRITEVLLYDSPDEGNVISFANAMYTSKGGIHVESVIKKCPVIDFVNQKINDKKCKLTIRDLRPHLSIVVSCYVVEPDLAGGQMKEWFNGPDPKIKLKKKDLEAMLKWSLVERLHNTVKAKKMSLLSKTDGKKNSVYTGKKGQDAYQAGKKHSMKCTLFITEGESASKYVEDLIGCLGGFEWFGYLPLKGKPINVAKITDDKKLEKLNSNVEYVIFKQMSGLKEGVDYENLKNLKTARYGNFRIVADADIDGKHIAGLEVTKFVKRFPGLVKLGRLEMMRSPIMRCFKGKDVRAFFSIYEYQKWANNNNTSGWKIRYYKGLGSSNDADTVLDAQDNKIATFKFDKNTEKYIDLAFGKGKGVSDDRKRWIDTFERYDGIEKIEELPVSLFIDKEIIEYSLANIVRSIPCMDGLKPVQRKILWTCMKKWGSKDSIRTATLAERTKDFTHYHHGEASVYEVINKMTMEFAGSNNLAYIEPDGKFGTRWNKKAAAPRYTNVKKKWWWRYIFIEEDDLILDHIIEEEEKCEPYVLLPIVPLFLINGAHGIGTGYSTYIPNYNPLDVCEYIKNLIMKQPVSKLIPWYKDFKGKIDVTVKINTEKTNEKGEQVDGQIDKNILEPDLLDYDINATVQRRMTTTGLYKQFGPNKVVIEELPINRSPKKYKRWLIDLITAKKITDYKRLGGNSKNLKDKNNVGFEIYGFKTPSIKNLRLEKTFGMTNMTILDHNHKPRRFKTVKAIMKFWFDWRLKFYILRLEKLIKINLEHKKTLEDRKRFIEAVIQGTKLGKIPGKTVVIMKTKEVDVQEQMKAMSLNYDLIDKVKPRSFTEEGLAKIVSNIQDVEKKL